MVFSDVFVLSLPSPLGSPRDPSASRHSERFNSLTFFHAAKMALESYVPVVIFAVVALLFPLGTFFATRLFRPDHPTPLKDLTYECGEVPEGEAQIQFHFQYYMFGLIFVVFDVAAIFLLLWAFAWGGLVGSASPVAKFSIFLFLGIMFVATQYALKKEEVIAI